MPDQDRVVFRTASIEDRVEAVQAVLEEKGLNPGEAVEDLAGTGLEHPHRPVELRRSPQRDRDRAPAPHRVQNGE